MEQLDINDIKKRIKDLKLEHPAYSQLLEDPQFRLIPTIDPDAVAFLHQNHIGSLLDLALIDCDVLVENFLNMPHYLKTLENWVILPGNMSLFRENWEENQSEDDDHLDELEFPSECAECHKNVKESDEWNLRVDNALLCAQCSSFLQECQSCSKVFLPDYEQKSEFCPDCEEYEEKFVEYLRKLTPPEKVTAIINAWIDAAMDYLFQKNMYWYYLLPKKVKPPKNKTSTKKSAK